MIGEIIDSPIDPSIAANRQVLEQRKKKETKSKHIKFETLTSSSIFKFILPVAAAITVGLYVYRRRPIW